MFIYFREQPQPQPQSLADMSPKKSRLPRVLTAIGAQGIFLCPFLTTVEIVGPTAIVPYIPWRIEYKTLAGSIYNFH